MEEIEKYMYDRLFEMRDIKYKDFQSKLIPTISKDTVIGVRTPDLRKFSKELFKMPESADFLNILPHRYYEENNLHGFLIEQIKDFDACIDALNTFLPYIDNWATCDLIKPNIFKKHTDELLIDIRAWIASKHTYTIRFGIEMLMSFYLDEQFKPEYLELVSKVRSEEYYVNMMSAWYFSTALTKQYSQAIRYIENVKLDIWTHNKAIQKAVESYRITNEQKIYLKSLKIKENKRGI